MVRGATVGALVAAASLSATTAFHTPLCVAPNFASAQCLVRGPIQACVGMLKMRGESPSSMGQKGFDHSGSLTRLHMGNPREISHHTPYGAAHPEEIGASKGLNPHPGVELRGNLKSISHRCHLFEVAFVWEFTKETVDLPLGCLQGGSVLIMIQGYLAHTNQRPPRTLQ